MNDDLKRLRKLVDFVDRDEITSLTSEKLLQICDELVDAIIDQNERIESLESNLKYQQREVDEMRQCY